MKGIRRLEPDVRAVAAGFGDPDSLPMPEEYYGLSEKPFSLTPDPKYLYKSQSYADAFDLLQQAIRRREGLVVVTGDIGTGKTTMCRAILEQLDRKTFTALVLSPLLSEDDLLRLILQDFGVLSRDELQRAPLTGISNQELFDALHEFLLSLQPLGAGALLIIDEAQSLPPQALEQVRILSNLETDKEKLLQIVLVGQLGLTALLRSPELGQLDQRVAVRYELKPLTRDETSAYIAHRLTMAGGATAVSFAPEALELVHKYTKGIPRLVNLLCDRALLGGYSARTNRLSPEIVTAAAKGLNLLTTRPPARRRATVFAAGAVLVAALAAAAYGVTTLRSRDAAAPVSAPAKATTQQTPAPAAVPAPPIASPVATPSGSGAAAPAGQPPAPSAALPAPTIARAPAVEPPAPRPPAGTPGTMDELARYSVLAGSFRQPSEAAKLMEQLRALGLRTRSDRLQSSERGTWYQVVAGPYVKLEQARQDEARVRQLPGCADAHVLTR